MKLKRKSNSHTPTRARSAPWRQQQVDLVPEEMHNSVAASVALSGDVGAIAGQLLEQIRAVGWKFDAQSSWWTKLRAKCDQNKHFNAVPAVLN